MNGCGNMANMFNLDFSEFSALTKRFEELEDHVADIGKPTVYAGAAVIADEIRKRMEQNLKNSKYSTGDMEDSFGIAKAKVLAMEINTKIGFSGYDSKGVPNQLKARAMESGTSKQAKRPFIRPALNASRELAQEKMAVTANQEIDKIINKK